MSCSRSRLVLPVSRESLAAGPAAETLNHEKLSCQPSLLQQLVQPAFA
ncbi:MAG: hypothetical protein KatS3mg114_0449 [Planctomycetaceae bacterium]|nr:MAG: hypothetical protein KatS3mg114_0449 [Planctomycetaceae bacterium]